MGSTSTASVFPFYSVESRKNAAILLFGLSHLLMIPEEIPQVTGTTLTTFIHCTFDLQVMETSITPLDTCYLPT